MTLREAQRKYGDEIVAAVLEWVTPIANGVSALVFEQAMGIHDDEIDFPEELEQICVDTAANAGEVPPVAVGVGAAAADEGTTAAAGEEDGDGDEDEDAADESEDGEESAA